MKLKKYLTIYLATITFCVLLIFLWWHGKLGMVRYFDIDEFAHMHWSYQMFRGEKPYIDFLFFFPPGFHLFLAPLYFLGSGVTPLILGRLVSFGIFGALTGTIMCLFWVTRRSWVFAFAGLLLAFLPIPFDKFLEIRPDTLATLMVAMGIVFQVLWHKSPNTSFWYAVSMGFCYGLSIIILPKTIPSVLLSTVLWLCVVWFEMKKKNWWPYVFGLTVPLGVLGIWLSTFGNISLVWYSLTKLPLEANRISQNFPMRSDLFFYPNEVFYGIGGWSGGLLVNHALWFIAIFVATLRLFTPLFKKDYSTVWSEILIASQFFLSLVVYNYLVPLKHTQYLIPASVFVAYYVADLVNDIWNRVKQNRMRTIVFASIYTIFLIFLVRINGSTQSPKLSWTNTKSLKDLEKIYALIKPSDSVLDLDGRTIYYKNPYYVCCITFGQFSGYLTRPLPSLIQALEQTKATYIYQGELGRVSALAPGDASYIRSRYVPSSMGETLLVRKK